MICFICFTSICKFKSTNCYSSHDRLGCNTVYWYPEDGSSMASSFRWFMVCYASA